MKSRPSSRCFLFEMEHIKLVCFSDKCLILNPDDKATQNFIYGLKMQFHCEVIQSCKWVDKDWQPTRRAFPRTKKRFDSTLTPQWDSCIRKVFRYIPNVKILTRLKADNISCKILWSNKKRLSLIIFPVRFLGSNKNRLTLFDQLPDYLHLLINSNLQRVHW